MKIAVTLANNISSALGLTAGASAADARIQNKKSWFPSNTNNIKLINERHHEKIQIP